jgi:hypothetical protein
VPELGLGAQLGKSSTKPVELEDLKGIDIMQCVDW